MANPTPLADERVFTNNDHAAKLAHDLRRNGYLLPELDLHLGVVAEPFFHQALPFPGFDDATILHAETHRSLARQLVLFMFTDRSITWINTRWFTGSVTMVDTLPFLWSFINHRNISFHGRFPFAALFDAILASVAPQELCKLWGAEFDGDDISDKSRIDRERSWGYTMRRYVRVRTIRRAADETMEPGRILGVAAEAHAIRETHQRFLRRLWALQQVLSRRSVSFALEAVSHLLWNCVSWLGVLKQAGAFIVPSCILSDIRSVNGRLDLRYYFILPLRDNEYGQDLIAAAIPLWRTE
jgi:hypothetical protein